MTTEYVKTAMDEGAYFVINSDAHKPEQIGDMSKGIAIAKRPGYRLTGLQTRRTLFSKYVIINLKPGIQNN